MHYNLWRRNGDPLARKRSAQIPAPADGLCTVPDCGKAVYTKALCSSHYHRLIRYGEPLHKPRHGGPSGPASPSWKGEAATYRAKHHRVYTVRGRAADQRCIWIAQGDCKGRMEWASQTGNLDDIDDFAPMCSRHHKLLDLGRVYPAQLS